MQNANCLTNVVGLKCQNSETDIYQPQLQKKVMNGRMGRTGGEQEAEEREAKANFHSQGRGYGRRNDWNTRTC